MRSSLSRLLFTLVLIAGSMSGAAETASTALWSPDLENGSYRNPVLFADYSDPDAIRVGEDYYLVSSSFGHVPALPILHSRDLVNWTLINHALPQLNYPGVPENHFAQPRHGEGVWAPALRYHAGKFWIYFPDPDFGLYVVTATDPAGLWSAPQQVKAGKGLIDPCPFWDNDGHGYLVHGWAKSRSGINNRITLHKLNADGTRVTDEGVVIIDADKLTGWTTLEGPKLYRRGEWYYIFAPAGGVTEGYQAVFRAKSLLGPWENRNVLAQGKSPVNGPHQGAWVDTPSGENSFLHFQDRGAFGRVVHLEPMIWRADGWPAMGTAVGDGGERGEPVLIHRKPATAGKAPVAVPATSDEFDARTLGLQWQWQANPRADFFSLQAKTGALRLNFVRTPGEGLYRAPQLLLQKFPAPEFTVTTFVTVNGNDPGAEAGLVVFGYTYAWIGLRRNADGWQLVQVTHADANAKGVARDVAVRAVTAPSLYLRATIAADGNVRFSSSADGKVFAPCGDNVQSTVGRWVGAKVGVFAAALESTRAVDPEKNPVAGDSSVGGGFADFDWFRVSPVIP